MPVTLIRSPWPAAEGAEPVLRLLDAAAGAVLAAVPAPDGTLRLEVAQDGVARTLWQGPAAGPVQMRRHTGGVVCLVPGAGLIDVAAAGGQAVTLQPEGPVPAALLGDGGEVWGVFAATDGLTLARLEVGEQGALTLADRIAAPALSPGQSLSALLRTGAGELVVTADDPGRGFHAWIGGAGGWRPLLADGAARHAMNARVLAALAHGPDLLLAVGPGPDTLARLSGVPVRGELLRARADGAFDIVCGELRPSPAGLKVPLVTARNPAARALGVAFTHLAPAGDGAIVVQQGQDGGAAFHRLTADGTLSAVGTAPGRVRDLAAGPDGRPVAAVAAAG